MLIKLIRCKRMCFKEAVVSTPVTCVLYDSLLQFRLRSLFIWRIDYYSKNLPLNNLKADHSEVGKHISVALCTEAHSIIRCTEACTMLLFFPTSLPHSQPWRVFSETCFAACNTSSKPKQQKKPIQSTLNRILNKIAMGYEGHFSLYTVFLLGVRRQTLWTWFSVPLLL